MASPFKVGKQGIPLTIFKSADYEIWLEDQNISLQKWLRSTGYKGEGLSIVPDQDGGIGQVIFAAKNVDNYFVCGDLVNQLPVGDYRVEVEDDLLWKVAFSWGIGCYNFNRYKKKEKTCGPACLMLPSQSLVDHAECFTKAVSRVRDLINMPANDMMPEHLAEEVVALGNEFNANVTQWVGDELLSEGFPTIHAVGRASSHLPRLIDLRWGDENHPKVTLVGKGVCFDSGGLNIKPTNYIRLMKKDMGGAANVVGLAHLIMAQKLPIRLRMLIPAVENAVGGNAFRPGDVIKTRKGLTVEIDNTDAEGRLILCDALTEADSENPDLIVDFATLTGACRIALGTEIQGMFSNDLSVTNDLRVAGERVDDLLWPLPLHDSYNEMLKSDVADIVNCAPSGHAGAITAALYLNKFVSDNTKWVHLDVMAWNTRKLPGRPIGGEAQGIRAVFDYLQNHYGFNE